jgi:radical SAM protein with 4Fe4S-binding SPASM domain
MIVYAGQRGIRTRINTNATLLSNSTAKELINAQLDIITFSFDGYDAETYEANRPNACFEKSLGNILGFLAMKKELGSAKPFVGLEVMEIADKSSEVFAKERRAFLKQFEGLPLDKFILRRQHNWAGMIDTGRQAPSTRIACPLLWHALVVFWDGRVLPCPQDFFGALELGNANEQGIMEIWNGFELRQLRREMANPNTLSRHPCVECDRIMRRTFAGVPTDYLGRFLSENVFGNSWLSRILPH